MKFIPSRMVECQSNLNYQDPKHLLNDFKHRALSYSQDYGGFGRYYQVAMVETIEEQNKAIMELRKEIMELKVKLNEQRS